MSKVITFSRQFPSYHPRKGEPTQFVEKLLISIGCDKLMYGCGLNIPVDPSISGLSPKHHTIRAGHRWKAGDWFSPRVWSGKPYKSKMIQFAPDIEIKKVWNITRDDYGIFAVDGKDLYNADLDRLAMNDGLSTDDLWHWIKWPMEGQIICWGESIEY